LAVDLARHQRRRRVALVAPRLHRVRLERLEHLEQRPEVLPNPAPQRELAL
jgi:hypothetical protein